MTTSFDRPTATGRRQFLKVGLFATGVLLAGCATAPTPAPTQAPAQPAAEATKPSAPAPAPKTEGQTPAASTVAPTQAATTQPPAKPSLADVPRNRTLILMQTGREGRFIDFELWNPYGLGANHQTGSGIFYEPLAFYSAFADEEILWLAESYEYSPDFKTLTIKTRSGINWSDGTPFSAEDVAFTLETLKELGSKVRWGVDVQQFVEEARATDSNTVVIKFKVPAPRFFAFATYKYDIGIYIVPKHIFEGKDWPSFQHYDLAKDWPVTTGPWKLEYAAPDQKVIGRRNDWWAVKAGLAKELPKVERIIYLPFSAETQIAQALITNQIDYSSSLQPSTMRTVLAQNPKVITHSGREAPYGYVDWWPLSLYVNCSRPPFDDADVRWALSYFVDRQQIVDVSYLGAGTLYPLPMPSYPALRQYVDHVRPLLEQYDTLKFDPQAGADLLSRKGWTKNGDGIWTDSSGNPLKLEIMGTNSAAPVGPVLAEQLRRQGVDASFSMPPDAGDRFTKGDYWGFIYGHGGSVRDPYETLRLYQSSTQAVPGAHQVNFTKWSNPDYDKIVDEVYSTPTEDVAKLKELFRQAMEIWLPELPDIQLVEFYHRIPMNTTYWTNWPTAENPYINGAYWHLTFPLVLMNLQPTQ